MKLEQVFGGKRPSEQLEDLMLGRVRWEDAQAGIRSWAGRFIYDAAKQILAAPSKTERRRMLSRIPESVRPQVEIEVKRLWTGRG